MLRIKRLVSPFVPLLLALGVGGCSIVSQKFSFLHPRAALRHESSNLPTFSFKDAPPFLRTVPRDAYFKLLNGGVVVGRTASHWSLEEDLLRFDEESELKVKTEGRVKLSILDLTTWTNSTLQIQRVELRSIQGDTAVSIRGVRVGSDLKLIITRGKEREARTILLREPALVSSTVRPFLLMNGLPERSIEFGATLLQLSGLTTVPLELKVENDPAHDEWRVKMEYLQHTQEIVLSREGATRRAWTDFAGLPIEAVPTSFEELETLKVDGTSEDILDLGVVKFPKIPRSHEVKKISVKISGVDLKYFGLNRHRQELSEGVLSAQVETLPTQGATELSSQDKKDLKSYLDSDVLMPVYNPDIQRVAHQIIGDEKDLWKRAKLITQFIFRELDKVSTVSMPNAIEILQKRRGDCNEHSTLFVTLARAAGVPSRMVVGLVYSERDRGGPGFYYHAWVEVYTGKEWVAIDPTWNQLPADATHLAFVEGGLDKQVLLSSLMGKIKLQLVSLER